jgi:hypothetical protein
MKFELCFLERAYQANLLRIRAGKLRELAENRTASATKAEMLEEARWCDERARRFDDAEEPTATSEKEPSRVNNERDIIVEAKA